MAPISDVLLLRQSQRSVESLSLPICDSSNHRRFLQVALPIRQSDTSINRIGTWLYLVIDWSINSSRFWSRHRVVSKLLDCIWRLFNKRERSLVVRRFRRGIAKIATEKCSAWEDPNQLTQQRNCSFAIGENLFDRLEENVPVRYHHQRSPHRRIPFLAILPLPIFRAV